MSWSVTSGKVKHSHSDRPRTNDSIITYRQLVMREFGLCTGHILNTTWLRKKQRTSSICNTVYANSDVCHVITDNFNEFINIRPRGRSSGKPSSSSQHITTSRLVASRLQHQPQFPVRLETDVLRAISRIPANPICSRSQSLARAQHPRIFIK
jgi:hypothetical protein